MSSPHEKREDIRVEYEAEFVDKPDALAVMPAEEMTREILSLLGPSTRTQLQRLTMEFRTKVRGLEDEMREAMEREVALKEQLRVARDHQAKLAEERDEWRAKLDPSGEIATLRENLAKAEARARGGEKLAVEHVARIDQLKARLPKRIRRARKKAR